MPEEWGTNNQEDLSLVTFDNHVTYTIDCMFSYVLVIIALRRARVALLSFLVDFQRNFAFMVFEVLINFSAGRGRHSHAYTHSVQLNHHVFLNLSSLEFYCLPDNYQIIDPSLEDIKVTHCY